MPFQFGFAEFLLLAVVALIVVGPEDLPLMMRKIGRGVGRMRAMAREFQSAFEDLAKQAELDELRKEIEQLKQDNLVKQAEQDLRAAERDINAAVMAKTPKASVPQPAPDPDTTMTGPAKPASEPAPERPVPTPASSTGEGE